MKKLLLLISLLLATNAWAEVVNLSCKSTEYLSLKEGKVNEINYLSLKIDNVNKEVTTGGGKFKFKEKGNIISFQWYIKREYNKKCPSHNPGSYEWRLDRVTGVLSETYSVFHQCWDEKKGEMRMTDYMCTETKPLF